MDEKQLPGEESLAHKPVDPNKGLRKWLWVPVVAICVLTAGGILVAAFNGKNPTAKAPATPSPLPGVSSTEQTKIGTGPTSTTVLNVTQIYAQQSNIGSLLANALQVSQDAIIQGNLTVSGNGTFGGSIHAANFVGSGAGLTGVDAALLNGQPGSYYAGLASNVSSLTANAALRNAANTFTAANAFNAGLTSATITDSGALTVTGPTNLGGTTTIASLLLSSPLTADNGGTGLTTVPVASVLYGQGGPTLGVATPGAAGLCLLSGASDVQWGSCSGAAAGVTTLDNLNGVLTLANSTGAGNTVTINNASTVQKGIAQFNATNFSVVAGAVNTIQDIAVTSAPTFAGLTLTGALTVANGGTGAASLAAGGVIIGNGTGSLSSVAAGSPNLCLVSTAGAPIWSACTGGAGGGVTSLNTLTGVLSVSNATTSGGNTITINDASTAQKGIAQFNNTNFSAAGGVINTIQNISTGATPTFAGLSLTSQLTVPNGGTGANTLAANGVLLGNGAAAITSLTTASPNLCLESTVGAPVWAACTGGAGGGVTSLDSQTGVVTIANSSGLGGVVTIQDAGTAQKGIVQFNATNFSVAGGTANTIQNISTSSSPTFTAVNTNTVTPSGAFTLGATGQSFTLQGSNASTITATGGGQTTTVGFTGAPTGAVTYNFDRAAAAGTYTICSTVGNCAGTGGGVTASGTIAGFIPLLTSAQVLGDSVISQSGSALTAAGTFDINTNSTTALNVEQSGVHNNVLTVDTTNGQIGINQTPFAGQALAVTGNVQVTGVGQVSSFQIASGVSGNYLAKNYIVGTGGVTANDVVVLANDGGSSAVIDTTTARDTRVMGVAVGTKGAGAVTNVVIGANFTVNADTAAVAIGDQLVTSATSGKVTVDNNATTGILGYATTSKAGGSNGTVGVYVHPVNGVTNPTIPGTLTVNTITPTGAFSVGATGQTFTLQGTNSSTIVASNGTNTTTLGFQNPTANVIYQLQAAAAGTYQICTTAGNCLGGASGGANTALSNLSGVAINTTLLPGSAAGADLGSAALPFGKLFVAGTSGTPGTNNFQFTGVATQARTITIPDASGTICLTTGNCSGAGGGIIGSGTINQIAKFTASGTIGDSSISDNGTSVTLGTNVNLVLQGGTAVITNNQGHGSAEAFGNGASVNNANETAVGNGATVQNSASTSVGAGATTTNSSSVAVGSGSKADWESAALGYSAESEDHSVAIGVNSNFAAYQATLNTKNSIAIGAYSTNTGQNQLVFGGSNSAGTYIQNAYIGSGVEDANPVSIKLEATSACDAVNVDCAAATNNGAAASFTLAGGQGTGTGNGGDINLQVAKPGSSGSSINSLATVASISGANGSAMFKNSADSTAAFQIQNAAGTTTELQVDTANNRVGVGGAPTAGTFQAFGPTLVGYTNSLGAFSVVNAASATEFGVDTVNDIVAINPHQSATAGTQTQNSAGLALQGSYWNGSSATTTAFVIKNVESTSAPHQTLSILNNSNATIASIDDNGAVKFQNSANSTTAFQVQNAAGRNLFSIDSSGNKVTLGNVTASAGQGIAGNLVFADGTADNFGVTVNTATLTGNHTFSVPDTGSTNDTFCLATLGNCSGSGFNVSSLDLLTGALTLANSSGSGSTVTINNAAADASTKGIATFNATNFTDNGSGTINTAQNINSSATPTFAGVNTNSLTPSAALTVGATGQQFTLQGSAASTITATGGGFTTTVGFTGTPAGAVTYDLDRAAAAGTYNICTSAGNCLGGSGGANTALSNLASTAINTDLQFNNSANRTINIAATGAGVAGRSVTIQAGNSGTGSVNGGNLLLQGGATGGSGITGSVIVKANGTDSTTAFQVQNSSNASLLTVDTSGSGVTAGSTSGAAYTTIQGGTGNISLLTGNASGGTGSILLTTGNSSTAATGGIILDTGSNVADVAQTNTPKTFESGVDNMQHSFGFTDTLTSSTDTAHGGTHSLKIVAGGTTWSIDEQQPYVISGIQAYHTYTFGVWIRSGSANVSPENMSVGWSTTGFGANLGTTWWGGSYDNPNGWTYVTGTATAPAGTTALDLEIVAATPNAGDVHYIDDFTVLDDSGIAIGTGNARTIDIGGASTSVISLDNENTGGTINIGTNGHNQHTINIGGANTGNQLINIGGSLGTSSTLIQGGTGSNAISLQAGGTGTVKIGTVNDNTIDIGAGTGSNGAVNIQSGNGGVNVDASAGWAVNIGTAVQNSVTIGNAISGNVVIQSNGSRLTSFGDLTLQATVDTTTLFTVKDSFASKLLRVDTVNSRVGIDTELNSGNQTVLSAPNGGDRQGMVAEKITPRRTGTITGIAVYHYAPLDPTPANDKFQVALYDSDGGACGTSPVLPDCAGTFIASSADTTITANAWTTATISATLTAGHDYWLVTENNGTADNYNNTAVDASGSGGDYEFQAEPYATWPGTFPGGTNPFTSHHHLSIYAIFSGTAGPQYTLDVGGDINSLTGYRIAGTSVLTGSALQFATLGAPATIGFSGAAASGAGNNLTIAAQTSGSGANNGGNLLLQAGATGGSGTTGSVIVKANGTNSTTAFQVQNAAGNQVFNVDTSGNILGFGKASTITGNVAFYNSGGSGSITVAAANPGSTAYNITLPASTGTVCLSSNNCTTSAAKPGTQVVAMGTATGCTGTTPVASQSTAGADFVSTSCTAADTSIQSAINALPANGGTVYIEDGTYIITSGITIPSNVTLKGAGANTVLEFKDSLNTSTNLLATASNSTVRAAVKDMRLDGNKANQSGIVIMAGLFTSSNSSPGLTVDHVWADNFFGSNGYGFEFFGSGTDSISNSEASGNGSYGFYLTSPNLSVTGSVSSSNGSYGYYVGGTGSTLSTDQAMSNTSAGIVAAASNVTFSGDVADSNTGIGIELTSTYDVVTGSTARNNTQDGIYLQNSYETATGNSSYNNQGNGIYLAFNNQVADANTIGIYNGAYNGITSNGNNNSITNNIITGSGGSGFAIRLNTLVYQNFLSGNQYSGTGATTISDLGSGTNYGGQNSSGNDLVLQGTGAVDVGSTAQGAGTLSVNGGFVSNQLATPGWGGLGGVIPTGGSGTTWGYKFTALDGTGESLASTQQTDSGPSTLDATHYNTVTIPFVPGAVQYNIYRTAAPGTPGTTGLVTTITGGTLAATNGTATQANGDISWKDTGFAGTGSVNATNTTGGANFAGSVTVKPGSNVTNAFQVQNASAVNILTVDTSTERVYVGPTAGDTVGALLVLGNKTNSGDPTEVDGAMYYNSSSGNFRCGETGAWVNCLGGLMGSITATSTVNNCTTACSAFTISQNGTNQNHVALPANFCVPGRVITIYAQGIYSMQNNSDQSGFDVRMGTSSTRTSDTLIGAAFGLVIPGGGVITPTNIPWYMRFVINCYTSGSSGTVWGEGLVSFDDGSGTTDVTDDTASTTTINTTTAQNIYIFPVYGTAASGDTFTLTNFSMTAN